MKRKISEISETHDSFNSASHGREVFFIATGLGLFCLLLWGEFLFGLRWPAHDTAHVFYPWRAFFSDSLRNGIVPLWDFWNTPGFQITFLNAPIWYPVALFFGLIAEFDTQVLLAEILFVSWLSSMGCYFWLRIQQIGIRLAFCGAVSWVASAAFVTSVQGMGIFTAMAFIPWVFLGTNLLVEAKSVRHRLCGVVVSALSVSLIISGGYLAIGVPILFFSGIYFITLAAGFRHNFSKIVVWTAVCACLTILLIALPIMDYFQVKSVIADLRGKGVGFDPFFCSLPAMSLWTLLVANGSYLADIISGRAEQMYIGTVLVLAIPVSLIVVRPAKRDVGFLFLAVLVFFAAMGPQSPVASFFVRYVPLMGWFRFHVFWSSVVVFLLITLSVRLMQKLVVYKGRGVGYGQFAVLGFVSGVFLIGIWKTYGQTASAILVFSFFEIAQYCVLIVAIGLIPLAIFIIHSSSSRKWIVVFLTVGIPALLLLLLLYSKDTTKILERCVEQLGGVFSPVVHETIGFKEKMILGKIGFPDIFLFGMDMGQFVAVTGVFCFLILVFFKRNRALFLSCILLLVVLDMLLGAQRYFHGDPKWLGSPKPASNIVVARWEGVLSQVATTGSFQYVTSLVPLPVVKTDLIEIDLETQVGSLHFKPEVIVYQPKYSDQQLKGIPVPVHGEKNRYRVQLESLYASFSHPIVEVRNYSFDKQMAPVKVTITVKRTQHGAGAERESLLAYGLNTRVKGDFNAEQFGHGMSPMTESYTPLFNPDIKKLTKDSRTAMLFSRLLWSIPGKQELTRDNSSTIIEEPDITEFLLKPNALYARVELQEPALLLWTDGWHEGWKVTVNGHAAELKKPLGVLKGVELSAGVSEVYFHYSPNYVWYGLFLYCVGFIGVLVILYFIIFFRNDSGLVQKMAEMFIQ